MVLEILAVVAAKAVAAVIEEVGDGVANLLLSGTEASERRARASNNARQINSMLGNAPDVGPHSCQHCRELIIDPSKGMSAEELKSCATTCSCKACQDWIVEMVEKYPNSWFQAFSGRKVLKWRQNDCWLPTVLLNRPALRDYLDDSHRKGIEPRLSDLLLCFNYRDGDIWDVTVVDYHGPHDPQVLTYGGYSSAPDCGSWVISAKKDDPSSKFVSSRPTTSDLSDPILFKVAQQWLKTCRRSHSRCGSWRSIVKKHPFTPTRLIEVTNANTGLIKLKACETLSENPSYVALSYCWGGEQPQKTVRGNLAKRQVGFALSELPNTIREAIIATNGIGFRYIWIDSLCIVQDDDLDKVRELGNMHRVYECAGLLISASSANNSNQGLFIRALEPMVNYQINYACPNDIVGSIHFQEVADLSPNDPIHSRGWTMQEHLLSNRILVYGSSGLRWCCRSAVWFEGPWDGDEINQNDAENIVYASETLAWKSIRKQSQLPKANIPISPETKLKFSLWPSSMIIAQLNSVRIFGVDNVIQDSNSACPKWVDVVMEWRRLVLSFQRRQISVLQDRLPAISSLAVKFGLLFTGKYLAGLWEQFLPQDLLWQVSSAYYDYQRRDQLSPFPSWSWASTNCEIQWENLADTITTLELVSAQVQLRDALAPYGHVEHAVLNLRGHLAPVKYHAIGDDVKEEDGLPEDFIQLGGSRSALFVIQRSRFSGVPRIGAILDDPNLTLRDLEECYCLEIIRRNPNSYIRRWLPSAGLVLKPRNADKTVFIRVGVFYMGKTNDGNALDWHIPPSKWDPQSSSKRESFFDEWPMTKIDLM